MADKPRRKVTVYFGAEGDGEQCWVCDSTVPPSNGVGFELTEAAPGEYFVCWRCIVAVMTRKILALMPN